MNDKVKKSIEISDAEIEYVSFVDKAANKRKFLFAKSEDNQPKFEIEHTFIKKSDDTHTVIGIVYEPMEVDAHDNFMTAEEIQKAADWFNENGTGTDVQHDYQLAEGTTVVKSWVTQEDETIEGQVVKAGTWLIEVSVENEDLWQSIEKGEITGFSMGGSGQYSTTDVKVEDGEVVEKESLLKSIAKALGFKVDIEKGMLKEKFDYRARWALFWEALWQLEDMLTYDYDTWTYELQQDPEKIREILSDFNEIITNILTGDTLELMVEKGVGDDVIAKKEEREGVNMTDVQKTEIAEIVKSVLAEQNKSSEPAEIEKQESMTEEKIQDIVTKALEESGLVEKQEEETLESKIAKMITQTIEKSKGESKQVVKEESTEEKAVQKGYMKHFK